MFRKTMNLLFPCITFFFIPTLSAQDTFNIEVVGNYISNTNGNEIWGWVDPDTGIEYGLFGNVDRLNIVSLEDPANPVLVDSINNVTSLWRDPKTYGNYCYLVIDEKSSPSPIQIIDLYETVRGNRRVIEFDPALNGTSYNNAHNLWVDDLGLLYVAGSNLNNGGLLAYDLTVNPEAPTLKYVFPAIYSHDVYARDSVVYSSDIYKGELTIYKLKKDTFEMLGSTETSSHFTHNSWLSDNGKVIFTSDELPSAYIDAYDISDPSNIVFLDNIKTSQDTAIPHNVHVLNDFLITSWYTEGVTIVDAAIPSRLTTVGQLDNHPAPIVGRGFQGTWGAYPFLPSGLIITSNLQSYEGMGIYRPTYIRASHMDISFVDAYDSSPIPHLKLVLTKQNQETIRTQSNAFGKLELDLIDNQVIKIEVIDSRYYYTQSTLDLRKVTLPEVVIPVKESASKEKSSTLYIALKNENAIGNILINHKEFPSQFVAQVIDTPYTLRYESEEVDSIIIETWNGIGKFSLENITEDTLVVAIEDSTYRDFFNYPLGWIYESNSDSIFANIDKSKSMQLGTQEVSPINDSKLDYGQTCLLTSFDPQDPQRTSFSQGSIFSMYSPDMMNSYAHDSLHVSFEVFEFIATDENLENELVVTLLQNGIVIRDTMIDIQDTETWNMVSIPYILEDTSRSNTFNVELEFLNNNVANGVVRLGIDNVVIQFKSTKKKLVSIDQLKQQQQFTLYPNPTNGNILYINGFEKLYSSSATYEIHNTQGQAVVKNRTLVDDHILISHLANGTYFVTIKTNTFKETIPIIVTGKE